MVTCWESANLFAHLYVMFICVFVTFLCGVMGQVWYLIKIIYSMLHRKAKTTAKLQILARNW